jgi:hypothetical protein
MKIVLGGSCVFAKELFNIKKELEDEGHSVLVTDDLHEYVEKPSIKRDFDEEVKISKKYDIIKSFFKKIEQSDALLIGNFTKNNIKGYLGPNVLMDLGLAYYLNKKIYLLNDVDRSQSCAVEMAIIDAIILNGDLNKIK